MTIEHNVSPIFLPINNNETMIEIDPREKEMFTGITFKEHIKNARIHKTFYLLALIYESSSSYNIFDGKEIYRTMKKKRASTNDAHDGISYFLLYKITKSCWKIFIPLESKDDRILFLENSQLPHEEKDDKKSEILLNKAEAITTQWHKKHEYYENPKIFNNLGFFYELGIGTEKNKTLALKYYKKSVSYDDENAAINLAYCYDAGTIIEKNPEMTLHYDIVAARLGNKKKQCFLGKMYLKKSNNDLDQALGIFWLEKANFQNYSYAQYLLGKCYQFGRGIEKDESTAFQLFLKAADQNHMKAQLDVANCYEFGIGTEKNFARAFKWYEKAVLKRCKKIYNDQGLCCDYDFEIHKNPDLAVYKYKNKQHYAKAIAHLGYYYQYGIAVEKNLILAYKLYNQSSMLNYFGGHIGLAKCYLKGLGVEKNVAEAINLFKKTAKKGSSQALRLLGNYYISINGKKHNRLAFSYYFKAAKQGDIVAQRKVGDCYKNGRGVKIDKTLAFEWYKKAAEQEDPLAQCCLGFCYQKGIGTQQNISLAIEWYKKSAEQGYEWAEYNLGYCNECGIGLEVNIKKAIEWYKKASAKGHDRSSRALNELKGNCKDFKGEKFV